MQTIFKYPRTPHVESSRLQPGDEDLDAIAFSSLTGRKVVVEEKVDGANAAISFSEEGALRLQSRGHYLTGGYRERHFALFKTWANTWRLPLLEALGRRYILFGEWLYAKHTIFYTDLPHYFLEFDIYDRVEDNFLDSERRAALRDQLPFVVPVKVLFEGNLQKLEELTSLATTSSFIGENHREVLNSLCQKAGLDVERVRRETDPSRLMEGLYLKVEEDGIVTERLKWVRPRFLTSVLESNSHWLSRPIIPNQLAPGVDIFTENGNDY